MLQGLVFIRGRVGPVRLVGRVGGPLEEGGFSDWSDWADWADWADWSEIFLRVGLGGGPLKRPSLRKRKIPRLWGEVRDGLIF